MSNLHSKSNYTKVVPHLYKIAPGIGHTLLKHHLTWYTPAVIYVILGVISNQPILLFGMRTCCQKHDSK